MKNFDRRPFNFLTYSDGSLFGLTCEYFIDIFERVDKHFDEFLSNAERITESLPAADFKMYKVCFWQIESIIDDYSKPIKCSNLSLGIPEGEIKAPKKLFETFSYKPNHTLQKAIKHGVRNTSQHFEERLQEFHNSLNTFLKISYSGQNLHWDITSGKGGPKHNGGNNDSPEKFDKENLFFQSYEQERKPKKLVQHNLRIMDIWRDVEEIMKLVEENIEDFIIKNNICCPPPRSLSVFITPSK